MNGARPWWGWPALMLCALLIGSLATGWWQESRLRQAERAALRDISFDLLVAHKALTLAVPDALTRALFGAQAVRDTLAEQKRKAAPPKP